MYVYATHWSRIYRFSQISWIEWLKHIKTGGNSDDVEKFGKYVGFSEGEMMDWDEAEAQFKLEKVAEQAAERRRKRRTG